jgi:hypothetical protein
MSLQDVTQSGAPWEAVVSDADDDAVAVHDAGAHLLLGVLGALRGEEGDGHEAVARANNDNRRGLGRERTRRRKAGRQGAFRAATDATQACVHALVVPARGVARQRVSARRSAASASVPAQTRANKRRSAPGEEGCARPRVERVRLRRRAPPLRRRERPLARAGAAAARGRCSLRGRRSCRRQPRRLRCRARVAAPRNLPVSSARGCEMASFCLTTHGTASTRTPPQPSRRTRSTRACASVHAATPPAAADAAHASSRRVLSDMVPCVRAFASNRLARWRGRRRRKIGHGVTRRVSNDDCRRRTPTKSQRLLGPSAPLCVRVRFLEARAKMDPFSSLLPPQAPQQSGALAPAMQQQSAQPALASLQQQSAQPGSYGGSDEDRRGVMSLNANLVRGCCVFSRAHCGKRAFASGPLLSPSARCAAAARLRLATAARARCTSTRAALRRRLRCRAQRVRLAAWARAASNPTHNLFRRCLAGVPVHRSAFSSATTTTSCASLRR